MNSSDPRKIELLSPAGGMDAFKAAVNAGADAVYLGIGEFSARRRAERFSGETLRAAADYAHLRGVLVYGALNILVKDDELRDAAAAVKDACQAGVDALIVQDWGMARIVREVSPDMRLHASTQMNIHNREMLQVAEDKGFKRATLAREMAVEEVASLAASSAMEIEIFAHGALCFSYSGQCLISSMVSGRSGNRGLCPQVCRVAYELQADGRTAAQAGKHLISTKDLCTVTMLEELAKAGVASLKLEGRLKSPEYVATVTSVYRRALDSFYEQRHRPAEDDLRELRSVFNRGLTQGYLAGVKDERMMSFHRPSDRGVMAGRVVYSDVYAGEVGVALQEDLTVGDVVEIWVSKGGRVRQPVDRLSVEGEDRKSVLRGERAVFKVSEARHRISNGDRVFIVGREFTLPGERLVPLRMRATVSQGRPLLLEAEAGGARVSANGERPAQQARTKPLTDAVLEQQLGKLGGTAYKLENFEAEISDSVMLPLSEINEVRRRAVAGLDEERLKPYRKRCRSIDLEALKRPVPAKKKVMALWVDVASPGCLKRAIESGADAVFVHVPPERPVGGELRNAIEESRGLARPAVGNVVKDSETDDCLAAIGLFAREGPVLTDNLGMAKTLTAKGYEPALDYHVNLLNSIAIQELEGLAGGGATVSVEASQEEIRSAAGKSRVPSALVVHGSIEVMTAEHPVVNVAVSGGSSCYEIVDPKGFRFPVRMDAAGRTHIYNAVDLCLLEELPHVFDAGIRIFRLLLDLYGPDETAAVVSVYRTAIDELASTGGVERALKLAAAAHPTFSEHTSGHFYRPVI
ncbi:MAG: DUF3656 domain-containing U32 family peptidase [Candidatus Aquicultorales bacterium]